MTSLYLSRFSGASFLEIFSAPNVVRPDGEVDDCDIGDFGETKFAESCIVRAVFKGTGCRERGAVPDLIAPVDTSPFENTLEAVRDRVDCVLH